MDLPKNEKSFYFKSIGDDTQEVYEGEFTVVCILNMLQKRAVEIEKSRLQADIKNPTDNLAGLGTVLANLRVRITKGPGWWQESAGGFIIKDENICIELFDMVMSQEGLWREELKKKAEPKDENLGEKNTESK
jgi:hypothetical protein